MRDLVDRSIITKVNIESSRVMSDRDVRERKERKNAPVLIMVHGRHISRLEHAVLLREILFGKGLSYHRSVSISGFRKQDRGKEDDQQV